MKRVRSARQRLEDIVQWGEAASDHIQGMDFASFAADIKTQHAVMKCIEVIGEAAGQLMKLMPDHAARIPTIDLRPAYLTRNQLSYFSIDDQLLWLTVTKSVPKTVEEAKAALAAIVGDAAP